MLTDDLTIGIQTYYNVTEKVAKKVAHKIKPWVTGQMIAAGISIPRDKEPGSENYSLLVARLVESEVASAVVMRER